MRAWLYDRLTTSTDIATTMNMTVAQLADQVFPREARTNINGPKPFLVYGLGNETNERLADDDQEHIAERQFFQVWIHDEGTSYLRIDETIKALKLRLVGAKSPADNLTTIHWLETSQEFSNETYNTIFRYVRFQAIISKGVAIS